MGALDNTDGDVDDWGGWDPDDWQGYWYRLKAIETAGSQGGDAAADARCRDYGLAGWSHMQRVRATFHRHFGEQRGFTQAAVAANRQHAREAVAAMQATPAILEPVEGVSLERYAHTQAMAAMTGGDLDRWAQVLAQAGCDRAKWERVATEWNRRMSDQAGDATATMALLAAHGKHFADAVRGQGSGTADAAGAPGGDATGTAPCTLERYAELAGAQAAWAQQGHDVHAMLAQQLGMSVLDWSTASAYWSARLVSDPAIAVRYGELLVHYTNGYLARGGRGD